MNTIVWSKSALAHLRAIRAYLEQFNPHAAGDAAAIVEAANGLAIFPYRGRQVQGTDMSGPTVHLLAVSGICDRGPNWQLSV